MSKWHTASLFKSEKILSNIVNPSKIEAGGHDYELIRGSLVWRQAGRL